MRKKRRKIHPYVFVGIHYQEIMENAKKLPAPKKSVNNFKVTQKQILDIVANECDITIGDLLSKSRKQNIVDARYICFAAIKLRCGLSLQDIGDIMDKRDHTTVIHGLRCFHNRYTTEKHYRDKADRVFEQIQIGYDGNQLTSAV